MNDSGSLLINYWGFVYINKEWLLAVGNWQRANGE